MSFTADTKQLRKLASALRKANRPMLRRMQKGIRTEGEIIAERARIKSEAWSRRIPGTIKVSARGIDTIRVKAGHPEDAPHAAAYEHAGAPGTFRHPDFGNRAKWIEQEARPFLHPAALETLTESVEAVGVAVQEAIDEAVMINGS